MPTEFEQLKSIAEQAKQTAMREAIKTEQLNDEKGRIFEDLEETFEQPIKEVETAEAIAAELKESITSNMVEYRKVLRELGYNV
ncbi:hypothetical protein V7159_18200 [Priestia megaterium]|uniref:hypothetical protein n=1 Tax=Priestia megaterium TaxID=1404 RepID=UPI0030086D6D